MSRIMDISKIVEQNKVDIRETELRKCQTLEQFREWLKKHPFIKSCRQGKFRFYKRQ
jgi:hypothetical protein